MVGRSARDIERALLHKVFRYTDSHHRFLTLYVGDETTFIYTYLSQGKAEYGDNLLAAISRQLRLSKAELLRLIDCQLEGEEYLRLMRERGHLS